MIKGNNIINDWVLFLPLLFFVWWAKRNLHGPEISIAGKPFIEGEVWVGEYLADDLIVMRKLKQNKGGREK